MINSKPSPSEKKEERIVPILFLKLVLSNNKTEQRKYFKRLLHTNIPYEIRHKNIGN